MCCQYFTIISQTIGKAMKLTSHGQLLLILSFYVISINLQAECIGVITAGGGKNFWGEVKNGGLQAGKDLGLTVYVSGANDEVDTLSQRLLIENIIAKGCKGLVLAPNTDERQDLIVQLKKKGVLTVFIDRDIGGDRLSVLKTDNLAAGRLAGREMVKVLNGQGKVAVFRYRQSVSTTNFREQGFIEEAIKGGLEIVIDEYIGTTIREARENFIVAFRLQNNVDGIFTPNESTTMGVIATLKMLNMSEQIKHIGFDSSKFIINALQRKQLYGFVIQNPYQMGYQGVSSVYRALQGQNIKAVIDTGSSFVNRENITTPEVKKLLNLP